MRITHADIPSLLEIELIKKSEALFPVPKENIAKHFVDFSAFATLWLNLDLDTEVFTNTELSLGKTIKLFQKTQGVFVGRVLNNYDRLKPYLNATYSYLSPTTFTPGQKGEAIFVHGSSSLARAREAVRLYKKGAAPLIIFSGRGPIYEHREIPEAETYKAYALEQGTPERDIWTEPDSITLLDNIKRNLLLWQQKKFCPRKIIIVSGEYYLRRCLGYWQKFTTGINFVTYGVEPVATATKENWYKNEDGTKRIYAEIMKLVTSCQDNVL